MQRWLRSAFELSQMKAETDGLINESAIRKLQVEMDKSLLLMIQVGFSCLR
jgi:hypothetical protein